MADISFSTRTDPRTRFETELFLPFATVVSMAILILWSMSQGIAGGANFHKGFEIPSWGPAVAGLVLISVFGVRMQSPREYLLSDYGIDIVLPALRFRMLWEDVAEVVSVSERSPRSIFTAVSLGTFRRIRFGLKSVFLRLLGANRIVNISREYSGDYTTSDSGGVCIISRNGANVLITPAEVSSFLRDVDYELNRRGLAAKVIREQQVRITEPTDN